MTRPISLRTLSLAAFVVPLTAAAIAFGDDPVPAPPKPDAPAQSDAKKEAERLAEESKDKVGAYPMPGEIVVSAARGVPLGYAGGRDVIEADTLNRYPDQNVVTALRRVPGVTILAENGNDSRLNIGIRGNDARRSGLTTILVDGVPISEAPYGNTDVDGLPVAFERISRIDVIRGGASIRWGPNSAGGVINIVTESIPDAPTARVAGRYGSDSDWSASTSVGGTWDQFGVLVNVVDKGGDGYRDNSEYDDQDFSGKFRWRFDDRNTLEVGISHFQELDAEQPGGLTQAAYDDDPWQSLRDGFDFRFTSDVYRADFVHEISADSAVELIGWYHNGFRGLFDFRPVVAPFTNHRNQNSDFSSGAIEGRYTHVAEIFGLRNSFFHSVRWLTEKNREVYENFPLGGSPGSPYPLNAVFSANAFSMFHEDTISLRDDLDLALGIRTEQIDMRSTSRDPAKPVIERNQNYNEFLPAVSLTWTAMKDLALYGSYQENFLTPQYETGFDPTSAVYRDVDPEHSKSYELGTRTRAVKGLEFSGAYFKTDFTDKIDFVNLPSGDKVAVNTGTAESHGVELGASYEFGALREELKGLSVYATWTHMRSEILSGVNEGNDTPNSPRRLASWGALYEHHTGLWARVGGSHTGSSFKDPENFTVGSPEGVTGPCPAYTLWDAAIGWRQCDDGTGLAVSVGVTNFMDDHYYRRFSTGIYPGAPRQYFTTASYTLTW